MRLYSQRVAAVVLALGTATLFVTSSAPAQSAKNPIPRAVERIRSAAWNLVDLDRAIWTGSIQLKAARIRHAELIEESCTAVADAAAALRGAASRIERASIPALMSLERRAAAGGTQHHKRLRAMIESLRAGATSLHARADDVEHHIPVIRMSAQLGREGLHLGLARYLDALAKSLPTL